MAQAPPPTEPGPAPWADWPRARSATGPTHSRPPPSTGVPPLRRGPVGGSPRFRAPCNPQVKVADYTAHAPGCKRPLPPPAPRRIPALPGESAPAIGRSLGLCRPSGCRCSVSSIRGAARVGSPRTSGRGGSSHGKRSPAELRAWRECVGSSYHRFRSWMMKRRRNPRTLHKGQCSWVSRGGLGLRGHALRGWNREENRCFANCYGL